ncbi:unnamed protein product [Calypogeia fissa]
MLRKVGSPQAQLASRDAVRLPASISNSRVSNSRQTGSSKSKLLESTLRGALGSGDVSFNSGNVPKKSESLL